MAGRGIIGGLKAMLGMRGAETVSTKCGLASSAAPREVITHLKLRVRARPAGSMPDAEWTRLYPESRPQGLVEVPAGHEVAIDPIPVTGWRGEGEPCEEDSDFGYAGELRRLAADLAGTNLMELSLSRCKGVTDAGLKPLGRLTTLGILDLSCCTKVTGAGLKHLGRLTDLTTLDLWNTEVTDAGLKHLAVLTSLTTLNLSRTKVTDAGLKHLAVLTNLTTLKLSFCLGVTDVGLVHLEGLTNLTTLNLSYTAVTDAGLVHLEGLTNLATLDLTSLSYTGATGAGVAVLKEKLPGCEVARP